MKKICLTIAILTLALAAFANDMRWQNGMKYFQEGNYEAALLRFEDLANELPDVYQYSLMKGLALFKLDRMEEALASLKHSHELNPKSADVAFAYAQVLQAQRNYDELLKVLGSIDSTKLKGETLDKLYYLRGITHFYSKDFESAAEDLGKVTNEQKKKLCGYYHAYSLYRLDRFNEALEPLETAVNGNKKLDTLKLKHKILSALTREAKDKEIRAALLEKSLKTAEMLVELDPSGDNYYAAGQTALFKGDMEQSSKWLKLAAEEGNGYASYYLSFAYIRQGDLAAAEKAIKQAEPKLIEAGDKQALKNLYCNWGHINHVQDNLNTAIKYYKKGECTEQLALAQQGKKAVEQRQRLDDLIKAYKEMGN